MKKLMIAVAMVACAIAARASSVTWGASAALDSEKIGAGTMYLVASSTGTFNPSKLEGQTAFTLALLAEAGLDMVFDQFDYSSNSPKVTASKFNAVDLGYTAKVYDVYAICIETGEGADYMAYSTKASVTLNNATSPTQSKLIAPTSFTYVQTASGPEPIPEPTSGLLLLLGMAGLALKRKRA